MILSIKKFNSILLYFSLLLCLILYPTLFNTPIYTLAAEDINASSDSNNNNSDVKPDNSNNSDVNDSITPTNTPIPTKDPTTKDEPIASEQPILPSISSLTYKVKNPSVHMGKTYTLSFKENISDLTKSIKWTTSNSNLKINSKGVITGLKAGTTKVTATYIPNPQIKATVTVTIKKPAVSKITTIKSISMTYGESKKLTVTVSPSNAGNKNLAYKSSNSSIASVDTKGNITAKLTGTAYITVTSVDQPRLTSKIKVSVLPIKVVIDPGHGGSDPGAKRGSICEKTLNLQMAKACKQELEKYAGLKVILTRSTDKKISLYDRAKVAKDNNARMLVSLHQNAVNKRTNGSMVIISQSTYKKAFKEESTILANSILKQLKACGFSIFNSKSNFGYAPNGILTRLCKEDTYTFDKKKADYYGVIRNCIEFGIPAIIVEHGFMDANDYYKMNTIAKQNKIGQADAKGIANFLKLKKIK